MRLGNGVSGMESGEADVGRRSRPLRAALLFSVLTSLVVLCALPAVASAAVIRGSLDTVGTTATVGAADSLGARELRLVEGITVTATADSRPYDGTTAAVAHLTSPDVALGDNVTFDYASATFADKNAGTGKTVTVTGITMSGSDAYKYTLSNETASTTADITPAGATITAIYQEKTYGESVPFDGTEFTAEGLVDGESVASATLACDGADTLADAGHYEITIADAVAGPGTNLANYTITYESGTMAVKVKELVVTAADQMKTYGETFTFTGHEFTSVGLVGSQSIAWVNLNCEGASAKAGVGDYNILLSDAVAGPGTKLTNYAIICRSGMMTVAKRPLTIKAVDQQKTYGESFAFTGTEFIADGLTGTDSIVSVTLVSDGAVTTANPGYYDILVSHAVPGNLTDLTNYEVGYQSGTLVVGRKKVTITPVNQQKTYGESFAFTGTEFTATGLLGADRIESVTLVSDGAAATADAGDYTIVASDAVPESGTDLSSYDVSYVDGSFSVGEKALTVADGVASSKTYDGTAGAIVSFSIAHLDGIVPGDTVQLNDIAAEGCFENAHVGTGKNVIVSGLTLSGTDAGNYSVTQPVLHADITAAPLMITANDQNKTYGDAFTFTGHEFGIEGLVGSESVASVTLTSDAAAAEADAGTYTIIPSNPVGGPGTDLANYDVGYTDGGFTVDTRPLTIIAYDQNKTYGDAFTFTGHEFSTSGLAAGDSIDSATLVSDGADAGAHVGSYAITLSDPVGGSGTKMSNYAITYADGCFTVEKKALTITAKDKTKTYGDSYTFTGSEFTTSGLVAGDSVASATLASDGAAADADTGNYVITVSDPVAGGSTKLTNYAISYAEGDFAVTPKALDVTGAVANDKVCDGTTAADVDYTSAKLNGIVPPDDVYIAATGHAARFADKNVGTGKPVTVTVVALDGADAVNYTATPPTGLTANITARSLTVTATGVNKVYDGTTDATVTLSSDKVSGDDLTLAYASAVFAAEDVATGIAVDVDGISIGGADAGNYTLSNTTASTTADITAKELTVGGAVANDKVYDGTTAATVDFGAASLVGVVAGDTVTLDTSGYAATFADKNLGTDKPVAVTGLVIGGADVGNYTLIQPTLKADITGTQPTIAMAGIAADDASWHKDPVTLTFTPQVGSYGVASVEYMVNGGAWTVITASGGAYTVTFSTNGTYAVSYRVTDNAGLVSAVGSCTVKIDNAQPVAKAKNVSAKKGKKANLKLFVAKDPVGCGMAKVTIKFYKGSKVKKSVTTSLMAVNKWNTYMWKCTLPKGNYTMKLYATDSIGNSQSKVGSAKLTVK